MRRVSAKTCNIAPISHSWMPVDGIGVCGAAAESSAETEKYRQAYLEGFDAGYADGDKEAHLALDDAQAIARAAEETARNEMDRWRGAVLSLTEQCAKVVDEQRAQTDALAVTIAFAAVCKLIGSKAAEQELVGALCREALANMRLEPVRLRVAASDMASLDPVVLALPVTADPALQPGDCIIDTPLGGRDVGAETQMQALLQALLAALGRTG